MLPEPNARGPALILWLCICGNLVSSLFASAHARGLYSDGVAYLVGIYHDRWFLLFDKRTIVQLLRQAPVVFAARYSSASLFACGQLFSFVMLTLPWVFCTLCRFALPKNQKQWIFFPLLATLVGFMATSVHAVGEAAIATSYEWLLILPPLFRSHIVRWLLLWIVLLLPAFRLHEGTFIFLIVALTAAAITFRSTRSQFERVLLSIGILILVATVAYQIRWVVYPEFPGDRNAIADGLLHGQFLYHEGHFNLQLINGIAALVTLVVLGIAFTCGPCWRSKYIVPVIISAWVLFCIASSLCAVMVEQSFAPFAQLQARYHPPLVSAFLASIMLVLMRYAPAEHFLRSASVLLTILLLAAIQLVADVTATKRWNAFVADLQFRLTNSRGLIPWETTTHTGNLQIDENWRLLKIGWVVPYFSIVYAPNGIVRAIINCPIETQQPPFNPADAKLLPRLRGIDYSPYERNAG